MTGTASSAVIIGGGIFPRTAYPLYLISSAGIVICCDGAVKTYLKHFPDRLPDMVIGDMDSVPTRFLASYQGQWLKVPDQDTNDQTKAFNWLLENHPEVRELHFIGATGRRADHTIANLSLLMDYAGRVSAPSIDAVSDSDIAFPMLDSGNFSCGEGRPVSIFSPDPALRIKSTGLEWPTDGVCFDNWWKASLNRACSDTVTLEFSHPSRALIILG